MIISSVVKSSFYNESVNHKKLLSVYEHHFGELDGNDPLIEIYNKVQVLSPKNQAPNIGILESINGDSITIESLRGKNVLLTIWGTWCPYCKEELKSIKKLIQNHGDKFTSVGISLDKDKAKWKTYVKEHDWNGIHLIDSARKSTFKSNYLVKGTNIHILIDKNGKIVSDRNLKPSSKALERLIENLK